MKSEYDDDINIDYKLPNILQSYAQELREHAGAIWSSNPEQRKRIGHYKTLIYDACNKLNEADKLIHQDNCNINQFPEPVPINYMYAVIGIGFLIFAIGLLFIFLGK